MIHIAEEVFCISNTELYRREMKAAHKEHDFAWQFMQDYKTPLTGKIVSFDFHIDPEGIPKLIEYSFFPPGGVGILDLVLEKNSFFSPQKYKQEFFQIFKPFTNIAIVDRDLPDQIFYQEFEYIRSVLENEYQKNVYLCEPTDIRDKLGELYCKNHKLDYVINRLPFSDGEKEQEKFQSYVQLQKVYPDKFCMPYREWCFSEKSSLELFNNEIFLDKLSNSQRTLLKRHIPKTRFLDSFSDNAQVVELFGSLKKIILKPLNSRSGFGVFLKPSNGILRNLLEKKESQRYIVQERIPASKLKSGEKYDIRLVFLNGNCAGMVGRVYSGGITNFRTPGSGYSRIHVE